MMTVISITVGLSAGIKLQSTGTMSINAAKKIRQVLYDGIMQKNIGWFDLKEHTTSVLTSAMSEDSAILNGVGTESIGPALEGCFALLTGIIVGFALCW
jgi:hypothetical protein